MENGLIERFSGLRATRQTGHLQCTCPQQKRPRKRVAVTFKTWSPLSKDQTDQRSLEYFRTHHFMAFQFIELGLVLKLYLLQLRIFYIGLGIEQLHIGN